MIRSEGNERCVEWMCRKGEYGISGVLKEVTKGFIVGGIRRCSQQGSNSLSLSPLYIIPWGVEKVGSLGCVKGGD